MPKISGGSLSEHRERTREALFEAFSRLMATAGFDAISMASLANEAGVGRTAIYNYFTDKEDLLLAYVDHEMTNYLDRLGRKLAAAASPVDKLRIYAREQLEAKRGYLFSPGAPLHELVSAETALSLREHGRVAGSVLRGILEECRDAGTIPEQDLDAVVQLVNGALTGRRVPAEDPGRSAFFQATESFVLRSVGACAEADRPPARA